MGPCKWWWRRMTVAITVQWMTYLSVCITHTGPHLKGEKAFLDRFGLDSWNHGRNVTLIKQNITRHTGAFCIFMFIKGRRNVEKHNKRTNEKSTHLQLMVGRILLVLLPCTCTWVLVTVYYCFYRWPLETQSFLSANKHPQRAAPR